MKAAVAKSIGRELPNCNWSQLCVLGYAIISEDGMVANSHGQMPSMVIPEDQEFLSEQSDRSSIFVHGRNSHENHPTSGQRKRLIVSGSVRSLETCDTYPNAFYWDPAGTSLVGSVGAWCFIGVPSLGRIQNYAVRTQFITARRHTCLEERERKRMSAAGRLGTRLHATEACVPRAAGCQKRVRAPSTC